MQQIKLVSSALVIAVCLIGSVAGADADAGPVEISEAALDISDLTSVLGLRHLGAHVALPQPATMVSLRLDFYKNGKFARDFTLGGSHNENGCAAFNVSLMIADLDHLPLGDFSVESHRFVVKITVAEGIQSSSSSSVDVSKDIFGDKPALGSSRFQAGRSRVSTRNEPQGAPLDLAFREIPLFYCIRGERVISGGATPEEILGNNPDSDVMIASFVFESGDATSAE